MARYTIVVGNQNYSSWSLRGWLALEHFGLDYEVQKIPLFTPGAQEALLEASSSGKVPVLLDQKLPGQPIWDSLAIIQHLVQEHPEVEMWPKDPMARAFARSAAAEVHASFSALRTTMPMNCKRSDVKVNIDPECQADLQRIFAIWQEGRSKFGSAGPYLAGAFSLVDVMYAPVVWRLSTYINDAPREALEYCETMLKLPAMELWASQARQETNVISAYDAIGSAIS